MMIANSKKSVKKRKKIKIFLLSLSITAGLILIATIISNVNFIIIDKDIPAYVINTFGMAGELKIPFSTAITRDNQYIIISDKGYNDIKKFRLPDSKEKMWSLVKNINRYEIMKFNEPSGLALDVDWNLYIADKENNRITKFNFSFVHLMEIKLAKAFKPEHLSINKKTGEIYTSNISDSKVYKFKQNGELICISDSVLGKVGGMTIGRDGQVYIVDDSNGNIMRFSPNLKLLKKYKIKEYTSLGYSANIIAIDSKEHLYIVIGSKNEILAYNIADSKFNYIGRIQRGDDNRILFNEPSGITVDTEDNIYIIEKNKILKIRVEEL
jgi:sugar lactone lactonase YvrE